MAPVTQKRTTHGQQIWDPSLYQTNHQYVYEYGEELLQLLQPQSHESILDIGCGTGNLTHNIAQQSGYVLGLDSSESMVRDARQNAPNIDFVVADARRFTLSKQFDAAFSNAALHWVPDAGAVVQRLSESIKPGGRFVAEFGGSGNVNAIVNGINQAIKSLGCETVEPNTVYYFPRIDEYAALLHEHGFETAAAWLFDRPTKLEGKCDGLRNWVKMFGGALIKHVPESEIDQLFEQLEQSLNLGLFKEGSWYADYRRIRIVAFRR